jgi:hypothetical protein
MMAGQAVKATRDLDAEIAFLARALKFPVSGRVPHWAIPPSS